MPISDFEDLCMGKGPQFEVHSVSFCPELTSKISKKGIRIYECPINYNGRSYDEGKKITFVDGLAAIWVLIKYRFYN